MSDGGVSGHLPTWRFVERRPISKQRDPIQGEFFNTESITTQADEVVREAVQNSLDAAADGADGVRVRIYVSGDAGALPPFDAACYFEGFWQHAAACGADVTLKDEPCSFVVVEDFGTTGLSGDEAAYEEPSPGDKNDFFYFFHAEGKSGKSGADRGRWGVGKYVFPKASHVNSFFALTVRADGPGSSGPLLMGQAVMKNHKTDGKSWEPDGWWAVIDSEGAPVPAQDSTVIDDFRDAWEVERTDEPGLTVVIPYVNADLNVAELRRSVVRDYFVAILAGKLTVDIATSGHSNLEVTRSTLDEVIKTLPNPAERDEVSNNPGLVRWAFSLAPTDVITIQAPTGSPSWQPELIPDDARQKIRLALDADQSVVVRVPVHIVTRTDGASAESFFDVLLCPDSTRRGRPLFVREGIIVSEVRSRDLPGVRAVVLIQEGAMANLLGDSETPAHTNWSDKTERFRGKYKYGYAWLPFVRQAPGRILNIVPGADDEEDRTLAAEFFSVASDAGEQGDTGEQDEIGGSDERGGSDARGSKTPPPPEPPMGSPQKVRVTKRQGGGFTVRLTEAGAGITQVDILTAYDTSRGNPFAKWSRDDFDVNDLNVEIVGGTLVERDSNRIVARVDNAAVFVLKVAGFDTNRDVRIRTHGRTE